MSDIARIERRLSNNETKVNNLERELRMMRAMVDSRLPKQGPRVKTALNQDSISDASTTAVGEKVKAAKATTGNNGKAGGALTASIVVDIAEKAFMTGVGTFSNDQTFKNKVNIGAKLTGQAATLGIAAAAGGPIGLAIAAVVMAIEYAAKAYELGMKMEARMQQSQKDQQRLGLILNGMGRS